MKTIQQTIQEIKERETARFSYKGEVNIKENSSEPCFSGCIDMLTTSKIKLGYNPKYVEESKPLESIVENPFEQAFKSLICHELNHKGGNNFKGCPRNINLHTENILEPVAETLSKLGFENMPVNSNQTLYSYFANLIEDIIDNSELGIKSDNTGMFLCYKDDAEHLDNQKFTPLFDAFVELQERLYAGKRAKKLIAEHHSNDKKVKEAVDKVMEEAGLDDFQNEIKTRRRKQAVKVFDRNKAINYCLDETHWPELSRIITTEFSKLIDKNQLNNPDYIKQIFVPLKGEADTFEDEMKDPEVKMKFAFKKYQQSGDSFEPPKYLDCFEALDLIYQRLARNLEIKTNASTRSETMPIMWYGKRPFEANTDKLSRARIGISNTGKLELRVKKYHEDDTVEYTEAKQNIPEIKFVMLDTSSSMKDSIDGMTGKVMNPWANEDKRWDNKSKYHYALLGWYGMLEYLKKQGSLKHTSVKFANYSNTTKVAHDLKESKQLALSPQFLGTSLDLNKIKNLFTSKQLIFSLSDGEIANWNSIKEDYLKRAKQNEYFHLQIGSFAKNETGEINSKPQMCQDLENAGLPVIYDDGSNIGKIIIDLTKPYVTRGKK